MKVFILTLQFLTRLPLNINLKVTEEDFAKGVVYFPIAGLVIGFFNLFVYYFADLVIEGIFPLICAVLANIVITGGLHLDGLADTCDGIFSARDKQRMLEIMKDSRIGTNGGIALIMDLLFRVGVLYNLPKEVIYFSLLLAPVVGRTTLVIIMKISRYARSNGMGGLFIEKQTFTRTSLGAIIGLILSYIIMQYRGLLIYTMAVITGLIFRSYIYNKIDGMTGDTVGATNEIVELVAFVCIAVVWRYGIL